MDFAGGRLVAETDGATGWITINQPERLNAVRLDMWRALPDVVAHLRREPAVRAIVVRGAGEKAFASGADIAEFEETRFDSRSNHHFTQAVTAATEALIACDRPVIAMIRGYCIGGGMVIASACDMRIASEEAQFAVPAGRLGLGYELDNYQRLAGIVGSGAAMEFVATGRRFNAAEALALRFLNRVTMAGDLAAVIADQVAMIAQMAPMTLAATKLSGRAALDHSLDAQAQAAIDACFDSRDYAEGRAAFHEKRAPRFEGR